MTWDPYLDLESGLLRNRLGITDAKRLRQAEAELTASRIYDVIRDPIPGAYDLTHLRAFHRHIFQDLYDWAGELRTVSIGRGKLFSLPHHIVDDAHELFSWLAREDHLRGRDRAEFVDGLTELYADLNALHPFRDGNGRTQRAFLGRLAVGAGHPIHWAAMDPAENNARPKRRRKARTTLCGCCLTASCTAADLPGCRTRYGRYRDGRSADQSHDDPHRLRGGGHRGG